MTAPAPRVAYQRTVSDMTGTVCCYEPPETATPAPEVEVTGVEDEPSDELEAGAALEFEAVLEVALEAALLEAVAVLAVVDVLPGIVCALTAPSKPTPATALKATPTVSRFNRLIAASRA